MPNTVERVKPKSVSHGNINRSNRPYWNKEKKDIIYIKHKYIDKVILRAQFVFVQRNFHKELRRAKRRYALKVS